jgi:Prolyl oligopeptidase family
MIRPFILAGAFTLMLAAGVRADGAADNRVDNVRRIPPPGVSIPDESRTELSEGVTKLAGEIDALRTSLSKQPELLAVLPDVQIFHKAVDWALRYNEFFRTNEVDTARNQLKEGFARAAALREGKAPWTTATGLVVRGYVSKIDGSIQPYGLVVPTNYFPTTSHNFRLDFWFHGRGEQLSELAFIGDRMRSRGEFTPPKAFVLHLYGRYCNGSRFAGETDFWEAFEAVKRNYPIDENRLVVRGFSLGGAACWHVTTHYASRWAAAAPGAGFSETADFLKVFQKEELKPEWWEQKLWRMYDSTAHALNTTMVPLVAYSGEVDSQIQAARAMEKAMAEEGLELEHLIGPKTGHSYEPTTKAELNRRIDALAARGRISVPRDVRFVTHTLRYNQMAWVTVDGLREHWEQGRVIASLGSVGNTIGIQSTNVTGLTLNFGPGESTFEPVGNVMVSIDGDYVMGPKPKSDRSWVFSLVRTDGHWKAAGSPDTELHKQHGLQGPIDDAFLDSFLFVLPTGSPANEVVGNWTRKESAHAAEHWRSHFRGDVRQTTDKEVTDQDIASHNLILWGDPTSNSLLARIAPKLPIHWTQEGVKVGDKNYPAATSVPVMIYPNPLNPKHYVVINSGFTFREYDYLNNARQTSKLPDWAIVDASTPVTARTPGTILNAGFFGERWEIK